MIDNKNKILIFIFLFIIVIILISASVYSYYYRTSPEFTVKEALLSPSEDINEYLTDSFISEIENSSTSSEEFLQNNVSNYSTSKTIENIETNSLKSGSAQSIIDMKVVTINNKTGFSVTTQDTYEATLVKTDNGWRIDEYKLIKSKRVE